MKNEMQVFQNEEFGGLEQQGLIMKFGFAYQMFVRF